MSIFGLDNISPGGMRGETLSPSKPAPRLPRQHTAIGYASLIKDPKTAWDRLFNNAYTGAFDQRIHLGNMFDVIQPKDFDGAKPEKRTRTREEWRGGERHMIQEDYWHIPEFDHNMFRETIHNAVRQGQADRIAFDQSNSLESEVWQAQDDETAALEQAKRKEQAIRAAMEQRRKESEKRAQYQQALNVASQARQARMANIGRQRFAADPATGRASGGEAASAKLLTHRGLNNEQKLGSREKLGKKSLLGA